MKKCSTRTYVRTRPPGDPIVYIGGIHGIQGEVYVPLWGSSGESQMQTLVHKKRMKCIILLDIILFLFCYKS